MDVTHAETEKTVVDQLNFFAPLPILSYNVRVIIYWRFFNFYKLIKIKMQTRTMSQPDRNILKAKVSVILPFLFLLLCCGNLFCQTENVTPITLFSDTIHKDILLSNKSFIFPLNHSGGEYNYSISFEKCTFNEPISLDSIDRIKKLDFSNSYFQKNASFGNINFVSSADFDGVTFSDKAIFHDLTFEQGGDMTFNAAHLPHILIFDYNSNIPTINFAEADFEGEDSPHLISLFKTDISKLWLDYSHFKLYPYNYAGTHLQPEDEETVYEALLKNFKDRGQEESYKNLDIEYSQFKYHLHNSWFLNFISCIWWNYGYSKELIFRWTAFFVLLFTLLTLPWLNYLNTKVYAVKNIPLLQPKTLSFRVFGAHLWYSFIYSSTIFFRLTLKIENINFSKKGGVIYIMIINVLGILCLAYLANFVLQK
ncbi:MAG TPA: pentapeptide repeat-containing protein [Chitinophagaceae bacterium]|nr:pentapeptide repeat-containing protein [Chitinophagaceae bacterium]